MAWLAFLDTDSVLIGYGEAVHGATTGEVDRSLYPHAPSNAAFGVLFLDGKPDLQTDGTYYWDQVQGSFFSVSRRAKAVPTRSDAIATEARIRLANGERLPDWLQDIINQ